MLDNNCNPQGPQIFSEINHHKLSPHIVFIIQFDLLDTPHSTGHKIVLSNVNPFQWR